MAYGITAVITGWMEYHNVLLLPLLPLGLIIIVFIIVIYRPAHPHILKNLNQAEPIGNQELNP
ncbi:MAG: hypothetical protein ABI374_10810 [Ginsengibacter sp.]